MKKSIILVIYYYSEDTINVSEIQDVQFFKAIKRLITPKIIMSIKGEKEMKKKIEVISKNRKDFNLSGFEKSSREIFQIDKFEEISNTGIAKYNAPMNVLLHSHNVALCGITPILLDNGETLLTMFHDDGFTKLPHDVQEFLTYHEVGHVLNNHLNMSAKEAKAVMLKRSFGILPKMEVEADCYAASVLGLVSVKSSLLFLMQRTNLPLISKFELFKRWCNVKSHH